MTQPTDDTQPHPTVPVPPQPNVLSGASGPSAVGDPPPAGSPSPVPGSPSMQALPPPATPSDWREPPWSPPPPPARPRSNRGPSVGSIVFGGLLLLAGIWFFLERTLGIDLPDIRWNTVWPILLIALGGFIVLRALGRR